MRPPEDLGVGIDVEEVQAFAGHARPEEAAFFDRVFSAEEAARCRMALDPARLFAARFAAKEAVIKAMSAFLALGFDQVLIEDGPARGRPRVRLRIAAPEGFEVALCVSHTRRLATAVAQVRRLRREEAGHG